MFKNLTGGTTLNYGSTLPDGAYDGSLFLKTGTDGGLYIYSFVQDANTALVGDQSAQKWTRVEIPGLYVETAGDTMRGNLTMANAGLTIFTNNLSATNQASPLNFIGNNTFVWKKTNNSEMMRLTDAGLQISLNGNWYTVWHNGNDGVNSGLDADLLDGQSSDYFRNATNINAGTLDIARFPFTPVQQGGGTNQSTNKVYIGWGPGSKLHLQVDVTNHGDTWPININGSAVTASSAASATEAANAGYLRSGGNGTPMTFTWNDPGGAPTWLWGSNSIGTQQVFSPANLTVGTANKLANFTIGPRSGTDFNAYRTSGHYGADGQPANAPSAYTSLIVAANSDVGLQITGGYNSDALWFRGWWSSGASFSAWRAVIHSGNIGAQSVSYATSAGSATTAGSANNATNAGYATNAGTASTLAANAVVNTTVRFARLITNGGSASYPAYTFGESVDDTGFYSDTDGHTRFANNGTYSGTIQPGGHLTMTGNITAYSDERLKKDVELIPDALEKVNSLRGVTFTRRDTGERGTGVIAQDVQKVLPEAVMKEMQLNGGDTLTVAYGNMVGLLIESIKELNAKVESLQQEIQELKK